MPRADTCRNGGERRREKRDTGVEPPNNGNISLSEVVLSLEVNNVLEIMEK